MSKEETKIKIIDAAESLFGTHGIAGTSLRKIIAKANVNIAAIHYHFGSKEEVVKAVYARRIEPINKVRIEKLDELEQQAGDKPLDVSDIISAFFVPITNCQGFSKKDKNKVKALFRHIHFEPGEVAYLKELFNEVIFRFSNAISRSVPALTEEEIRYRFMFMIGVLAITMSEHYHINQNAKLLNNQNESEEMIDAAIRFITGGFSQSPVL